LDLIHHHHISVVELGHLLTCSGLTYPEVSSTVFHDSFCQLGNSVSLPWVIYCEAFYLRVVSSSACIPVICPELVLFLIPLQFLYLFCILSKCILLFISYFKRQLTTIQVYGTFLQNIYGGMGGAILIFKSKTIT
jgi:hypothetical protein